jgi:hypothetical protein
LAQFSAKNKVNIHGVSHNVFFQGTLQIKADANFAVNDFA